MSGRLCLDDFDDLIVWIKMINISPKCSARDEFLKFLLGRGAVHSGNFYHEDPFAWFFYLYI